MKLKKVEILGFKSFADKISLSFHDGITCIVGPNGCGKSNIADAMRWVFGEQSAKSLRGDKMVDVIFAGAASRKSLNLAEVTITFSEIQGTLPLDYEEIAVTRRLHRNGESDYFINKQPVRLKDIQNIFLDTGIGRTAFSIFEQGKIDQIIQYSPTGRRILFEEAAGITRYLQRKKETLRKFEAIDLNLSRAKDIFNEVELQIVKLEEQSKKATVYQNDRLALEHLEKNYLFAQHQHFLKKEEEMSGKHKAASFAQQQFIEKYEKNLGELKKANDAIKSLEASYSKLHEETQLILSEQRVKLEKEKLNKNQLSELKAKKTEYEKELIELTKRKNGWIKEIEEGQKKQKIYEAEIKKASEEFAIREKAFQNLESELSKLREIQAKSHKEKVLHIQRENQVAQDLKTLRMRFENNQEKKHQFEERCQRLQALIDELASVEKTKKETFQKILKESEKIKSELTELDANLKNANEKISTLYTLIEAKKKSLQENVARKNALLRLKADNEGFSAGSKKLLRETATPGSSLFGLAKGLYEFIVPESGFERDIAGILKPYNDTLVVESLSHLHLLLAFAKQKNIQDFSVICLETLAKKKVQGCFLERVTKHELADHFLSNITLSEELNHALELSKQGFEIFTNDKVFVDRFQVVHIKSSQENSIFVREAEIKELNKKEKLAEVELEQQESELKIAKECKSALQTKRAKLDSDIRSNEIQSVEANFGLQKVQNEREKAKKEVEQVIQEIDALTKNLKDLEKQTEELEQKLLAERKKAQELIESDATIEKSLHQKMEDRRNAAVEVDAKRKALFVINDENRRNQHALSLLDVKKQESENSHTRISDEISKHEMKIKLLSEDEIKSKGDSEQLEVLVKEKQEASRILQNDIKSQKEAFQKIQLLSDEVQKEIKNSEKNIHHFEVQLAQVRTSKESIAKTIQERFGDLQSQPLVDITFEKMEKEIKQLRQKLDLAKDVNLSAIEDFEKCKERYEFLNEQIQDLSASKKELEEAIETLDSESRQIFEKTFLAIKSNFKKNFSLLFNGGEADLELVESKDVLEAGIEIIAKPPGKQMRSLSLLSGGEKCLTAMALLFSIFEVKSAPFCILDEIDAPLDDSNIERFVQVVKQFIDRCQFIIITHNKQTMAIADRIFGVSMQEKGVSKLLSIEFDRQDEKSRELVEVV